MGMKKDHVGFEFEMKLPQRDWMSKVVCDALGDVHQVGFPCHQRSKSFAAIADLLIAGEADPLPM